MDRSTRDELAARLFGFLDTNATSLAAGVYQQPVAHYFDTQRLARERAVLFRG